MPDWIDELNEDDFPEAFEPFLDVLGIRPTVELAERMGGMQFYLPKVDKLRLAARRRMILADRATGLSYRAIALRHRVTEVFVRELCDHDRRGAWQERQGRLF